MLLAKVRRALGTCAVTFVSVGWSAPARAQRPELSSATTQVKQLYDEGYQAAKQGQWAQAYPLLQRAWDTSHLWQVASLLGRTELELGKHREAAEHLTFFLRQTRGLAQVPDSDREDTAQLLARAKARVGALTLVVEPAGADVLVDGTLVGRAPLADPVFVEPGWRRVEVRRVGYPALRDAREVAAGEAAVVRLTMVQPPPPPPTSRGWRAVDTGMVVGGSLLAVAAAAVGTAFFVKANRTDTESHQCETLTGPCEIPVAGTRATRFFHLQDEWVLQTKVWRGSFAAAGALAVGTITYAIVVPKTRRPATLAATAGTRGAGVALSTEW